MFKQDVTYWQPVATGVDEDGNTAWRSPGKVIKGRWQDKVEQAQNADGELVESKAVAYVPGTQEMEEDWRMALGCFQDSDPDGEAKAYRVIAVGDSPSVRNKRSLKKIWLA
jgi:hypothetical protein